MQPYGYDASYFDGKMSGWTTMSIGVISSAWLATLRNEPFPPDGIAIDFGCGSGAYPPYLKQSSLEVVGADISSEAVKQASNKQYRNVLLIGIGKIPLPIE